MSGGVVGTTVPRIIVFRPTMEEFQDFTKYIGHMESQGANKAGLAKVIPPKEWIPRKSGYNDIDHLIIPSPISQMVTGRQGLYQQYNIQKRPMTVKEFKKMACSEKFRTPDHFDYEDLERKYWKNITYNSPIYGADVSGSLYDPEVKEWNINHLNTVLDCVSGDYGIKIDGVNTAYLYFGMWKTSFAWHTEDMDLYSINYLHFGAPKSWYVIPPEHGKRLERLANGFFPSSYKTCAAFLRHKMTIISPKMLKQYSIPVNKITQEPGEFMITFPYGYHAGYNHGFNCAESTNFAMERWVEYGKRASQCMCRNDSVKISMEIFVKKYQPDRYDLWVAGRDVGCHPEDPTRTSAAPPPSRAELVMNNRSSTSDRGRRKMNAVSKRHPISDVDQDVLPKAKRRKQLCPKSITDAADDSDGEDSECDGDDDVEEVSVVTVKCDDLGRYKNMQCHVVLSQKDVESGEYKVAVGNLVKSGGGAGGASINPVVTSLPETVRRLQHRIGQQPFLSDRPMKSILQKPPVPRSPVSVASPPFVYPVKVELASNVPLEMEPFERPASPVQAILPTTVCDTAATLHSPLTATASSNFSPAVAYATFNHLCALPPPPGQQVQIMDGRSNVVSVVKEEDDVLVTEHTYAAAEQAKPPPPPPPSSVSWTLVGEHPGVLTRLYSSSSGARRQHDLEHCCPPSLSPQLLPDPAMYCQSVLSLSSETEHNYSVCELSPPTLSPQAGLNGDVEECDVSRVTKCATYEVRCKLEELQSEQEPASVVNGKDEVGVDVVVKQQKDGSVAECDRTPKDETERNSPVKREEKKSPCGSQEDWTAHLSELWQYKRMNFDAEMKFNEMSSGTMPHCSICFLFALDQSKTGMGELAADSPQAIGRQQSRRRSQDIPWSSPVLVPESIFLARSVRSLLENGQCMTNVDDDGCSRLLVCKDCKVCVHASCYGVWDLPSKEGRWRCSRCIKQNISAECCLCSLRGGALKPTTDARWAHVVCVLAVHDVFFEQVPLREPINTSRITLARLKLKCVFCHELVRQCGRYSSACIRCNVRKCSASFHVTCGMAAGVKFEACDWPELIRVTCTKHRAKPRQEALSELSVGQTVIGKHRNGRYYRCVVRKVVSKTFYSVNFEDGSTCDNLYPCDVESHNCEQDGPPEMDEQISVRWTDNKLYDAVYRGKTTNVKYEIVFEDGAKKSVQRSQVYLDDGNLPQRVKTRLSVATNLMQNDIELLEDDAKRPRMARQPLPGTVLY